MYAQQHRPGRLADRQEGGLARRPGLGVSAGGRVVPARGKTPGSGACLRGKPGPRALPRGGNHVRAPVGKEVGPVSRLRKAKSDFCRRRGRVWVPEVKKQTRPGFLGAKKNSEAVASSLPALTEEAVTSKGFFLRSMVKPEGPSTN